MQVPFAHLIGQERNLENKEAGTPGDSPGNPQTDLLPYKGKETRVS